MAASKKAGKKPVAKKPVTKVPVKKVVEKPAAKKSRAAPVAANATRGAATVRAAKSASRIRKPKIVPQPEWRISLVFGTATGVFGLGSDQRIYRWNTRSALWVLHKEGLSSTQA